MVPELSVIMGVYNCPAKEMLVRAINSILDQTFHDLEFIICDDGSTNDTFEWLSEKSRDDDRIILIKLECNKGLAVALNKCLEKAKGKYIARQDIDDYSAHTRFETQINFLDAHKNIAFVGTSCFLYDKDGIYGERHMPEFPSRKDFLFNSPFIHGTSMFRREVFEKCGNYQLIGKCHKYEDYDFFIRAYAEGFLGANINKLLYTFYSEERKNLVSRKMRLDEAAVRSRGFKRLGLMPGAVPYIIKPLLLIFIPNKILNCIKDQNKNSLLDKQALSLKMYKMIVNRNIYVKFNYERFVNNNRSMHSRFPFISWAYLIKLNAESILFKKENREPEKPHRLRKKESCRVSADELADELCKKNIVSFDIFDTLIFRPFAVPTDLFYLIGEKLDYPDFRTIRIEAEKTVRKSKGGRTVTLKDIYDLISEKTGINSETGQRTEISIEYDLCSFNTFMKDVWERVKASGRKIILISDMYLPLDAIESMLEKCGYTGYSRIFISCECGCGKHDSSIYDYVRSEMGSGDIYHIGDNFASDVHNAEVKGLSAVEYKNINSSGNIYRPKDMSPIIGSAYSGIVNRKFYSGKGEYSPAYEYGFKYGGLLILGFCEYIHRIVSEKNAEKILFFSRDGFIVKKIFEKLYPCADTEYVYWSRNAAAKLGADIFHDNFINRFITQKINHNISVYDIMASIGIAEWDFPFALNEDLTSSNASVVLRFIKENWDRLIAEYENSDRAAQIYFRKILGNSRNVVTVDCGWAGSGNIILEQLVNRKWGMNCTFTGVLAGSNSYNQFDSDTSETFFLNGKMSAYCFSSCFNRDKYKFHMPAAGHNIYFELLFSAPEPSFREFKLNGSGYEFVFDKEIENLVYIEEIQKGETDFINEYLTAFRNYPFMRNISGSDAYTPFMEAMKHSRKYIEKIFSECVFDELTNGKKVKIK